VAMGGECPSGWLGWAGRCGSVMAPGQAAIGSWNSMAAMGIAESVCRLSLGMGLTHCRGIFLFAHGAWALSTKTINNNLKYYYRRC
jgi:hypothetical protein